MARKEMMHILRDPFTLALAVGLPIILVVFFGFAIDFDFRDVKLAVYDSDNTRQSREFAGVFSASGYFKLDKGMHPGLMLKEVESEKDFAAVVIPPGFGRKIAARERADVQLLVDGTDNQKAGIIVRYLSAAQGAVSAKLSGISSEHSGTGFRTRFLYNPELNTRWFIVPGLIVIVIGILSVLMTALTVAREWESGSMELLLSTPVQPAEIIIGKILPYVTIAGIGALFVYLSARFVFAVPFLGSHLLLLIGCLIFILSALAQGILISVITRQQQKSMQMAMLSGFLPVLLLSGFIFPVESMADLFRYLTAILPHRWFMTIIRALFLKGSGLYELQLPFLLLTVLSLLPVAAAIKKFKKDIEP